MKRLTVTLLILAVFLSLGLPRGVFAAPAGGHLVDAAQADPCGHVGERPMPPPDCLDECLTTGGIAVIVRLPVRPSVSDVEMAPVFETAVTVLPSSPCLDGGDLLKFFTRLRLTGEIMRN